MVTLICFLCSCVSHEAAQYRPSFGLTYTLPPKYEKPSTAETIYAGLHYRRKNIAIFCIYRLPLKQYRQKAKTAHRQKNHRRVLHYRRKNTTIFVITAYRQSRYRQNPKYRLPPKKYRRIAIPPRLSPPKKNVADLNPGNFDEEILLRGERYAKS